MNEKRDKNTTYICANFCIFVIGSIIYSNTLVGNRTEENIKT